MLTRYRLVDGQLVPHPEGEFVRTEEAARSFQWRAFDKVLAWINTQENRSMPKGDLYAAVMEMRPERAPAIEPHAETAPKGPSPHDDRPR